MKVQQLDKSLRVTILRLTMMKALMAFLLLLVPIQSFSQTQGSQVQASDVQQPVKSVKILTSIRPLQLIIELLKAPLKQSAISTEVSTLLPVGATPHDYVLKPSDIVSVLQADLIIWMGPQVEPYLSAVVARADKDKVIDVSQLPGLHRLPVRPLLGGGKKGHHADHDNHADHHIQDSHEHELSFDPHVWWSVANATVITEQVYGALMKEADDIQVAAEVNRVISPLKVLLQHSVQKTTLSKPSFIVFHDGLQYLEQELSALSVARVAIDNDHRPGIKTLLALKKKVTEQKVRCVVSEPNSNLSIIAKIEGATPLQRVTIDSLGWDVDNYEQMLRDAYHQLLAC